MVVEIELTNEMLKVLPLINLQHNEKEFKKEVFNEKGESETKYMIQHILQIDSENLLLGTDAIEDIAFALDLAKQNEPDQNGDRRYDKWVYEKIEGMYNYLKDNILYIESIIHQFIGKDLKPGIYRAKDNELIWKKIS